MKKLKKVLSAFCLAAGLALAVPTIASFVGISGTMSTVQAADGWKQDSTGYYYLKDGKRLTGMKKVDGATYYFNKSGYRTSGPVKVGTKMYYFNYTNGKLVTGVVGLRRPKNDPTNSLYIFTTTKDGSIAFKRWAKSKSRYYYADEKGRIKLGTITVDGKLYHITEDKGRLTTLNVKSSYDGKYYAASASGVLYTGLKQIGGDLYYFNTKTGVRKQSGAVTTGGHSYYFKDSGKAYSGWLYKTDSHSKHGLKSYYYYDPTTFQQATGWTTLNNVKFYFDPKNGNARVALEWHNIKGYYYYFNKLGVLQKGKLTIDGKTYLTNENGARRSGWIILDNKKYFFDTTTGAMKTGWFTTANKNKYYFEPNSSSPSYGAAAIGHTKIGNYWYFFYNSGAMRTGWLLVDMKYYYYYPSTGRMATGTVVIDGKTYNFGTSGAIPAQIDGSWSIKVNRKGCYIVVYKGTTPVKSFICSTAADGVSTPTGNFTLMDKLRWHELNGPSWGQYCSHITASILFHSVPCLRYNDNHSLNASAFNMLGSPASGGCIRLTVKHAKWLYDNCPIGTLVTINDSVPMPTNVPVETAPKIPLSQNYDPTDPAI